MHSTPNAAREQLTKLAEALYRFAQSLDSSFASHLRQLAVELAGALETDDQDAIAGILTRTKGVLALGESVHAIAANDAWVISAAITRSKELALPVPAKKEVSVAAFAELAQDVADKEDVQVEEKQEAKAPEHHSFLPAFEQVARPAAEPAIRETVVRMPQQIGRIAVTVAPAAAADRQAKIVAAIRHNPEARMRDLLAALPGVSERTIRYDLERLVSSGTIEREGVGGPATRYRLRQGVTG